MELRADSATGRVWEQRVDRGTLLKPVVRADGTLLAEGYPVREGVLTYIRNGRTIREYVPASTIADSAAGLARLPVTLEHPVENGVVVPVTPANHDRWNVGDTDGNVMVEEGGFARVQFAVRRGDALSAVRRGTRELSALYDAEIDPTPGEHPTFGPYDAIQVSRRYNSIAITERGRAGREARLRADAAETLDRIEPRADTTSITHEAPMHQRWLPILLALGITQRFDSDDSAASAVDGALRQRSDSAASDLTKAKAETAAEKARADKAEGELAALRAAEKTRADAAERTELEALAATLGVDTKAHADNKALRVALAAKHLRTEVKADSSDDFLRGVLAGVPKATTGEGRAAGRQALEATRTQGRADSASAQGDQGRRKSANQRLRESVEAARKQQAQG